MKRSIVYLLATISLTMIACDDDNSGPEINTPETYSFTRDGISTVAFSGQTIRIGMATELVSAMKDFSKQEGTLLELYSNQTATGEYADPYENETYNASSKSVKSKVAASSDFFSSNTVESANIKGEIQSWISRQISEVFQSKDQMAQRGQAGQIADGSAARYVNAKGLEYNQAVNKSLIGALMVDQICNNYLSTSVLDAESNRTHNNQGLTLDGEIYTSMEHKWDEAYGYLFGASADPSQPLNNLGEDAFLNKYLKRTDDDQDFAGIASDIYEAFKLGRAAIVGGDYTLRDKQANIIKERISEVIAIRAVYYLQQGKGALARGDMGGAFHDLSEGFGFVYSLRFTRQPETTESYFTPAEVNAYISLLMSDNGFWDIDSETLDVISDAIASKFEFTVAKAAE